VFGGFPHARQITHPPVFFRVYPKAKCLGGRLTYLESTPDGLGLEVAKDVLVQFFYGYAQSATVLSNFSNFINFSNF
jgi:hypothetical protein